MVETGREDARQREQEARKREQDVRDEALWREQEAERREFEAKKESERREEEICRRAEQTEYEIRHSCLVEMENKYLAQQLATAEKEKEKAEMLMSQKLLELEKTENC